LAAGSPAAQHGGVVRGSRSNLSEQQAELAAGCDGAFSNPVRRAKNFDFCI